MATCIQWAQSTRQECSKYEDQGHNSCADWDSKCCDWWPCSWACKVVTWFCNAWYWVANVVCVAWTWVVESTCVAWEAVVTVVSWVVTTVESIVGWVLDAVAWVIGAIFSIPIIGRLIRWVWDIVLTVVWGAVSLVDGLLGLLGWLPEKRLRICVILLRQPNDDERTITAAVASCVNAIQQTIDIFWDQAHVRVIPVGPFNYTPMFGDKETATTDWVKTYPGEGPAPGYALDADCNLAAGGDDLWLTGSYYEWVSHNICFFQNWRNVTGYGAPVAVFDVRTFNGEFGGCSLGPLNDWVTVDRPNVIDMAHELGHSCNLWHVSDADNLMNPDIDGHKLHSWQVAVLRMSRHVSYL